MKTILITIIGLLLIAVIGLVTQNFCLSWQMDKLESQADDIYAEGYDDGSLVLPSVADIQRRIGCEKIDGWLCKAFNVKDHSETQTKWDAAYCQQSANVQINPKSMGIEK